MKKIILYVLLIFTIVIFLVSSYNVISWKKDKIKVDNNLNKVKKSVIYNKNNSNELTINFDDLKKINKNTIGWIKVVGTNVDAPFVQTNDNKFYLTHSFDNSINKAGWIFLDYRNDLLNDKNTILYAHGRLDGSMFGSLRTTLKKEWFNSENNHYIYLYTDKENYKLKIFSIYKILTTNDYLKINFTDNEYINFLKTIKERSIYEFNTKVSTADKIITLSTCYNKKYKIVVHAKLMNSK